MDASESLPIRTGNGNAGRLPRSNKLQLLFEFDMQRELQSQEKNTDFLTYFLPEAYPPSVQPLKSLELINLSDLVRNERRKGCVIYLKTIETAFRAAAIQTIVEDEEGEVERLAIYNIDLSINAEEFLPEGALVAVKEPMLVAGPSCGYAVRVDHPSDLVLLSGLEDGIPQKLVSSLSESPGSALEWKETGNKAYGSRKYLRAISAYSAGLGVCTETDTRIRHDLFRNRAVANILLGRFKQGLEDSKAAVVPEPFDEATKALNAKSYERAGHAAYCLGDYGQAETLYRRVLDLSPDSKEALQASKRIEQRRKEQTTGNYDFTKMNSLCSSKRNRLDYASFLSNTEIRDAGDHGRGLFTTRPISTGEVIICEKALCVSFDSDPSSQDYKILDSLTGRKSVGTLPLLLFNVVSKLSHNLETATKYYDLISGYNGSSSIPQVVDGVVVVDVFKIQSTIYQNVVGCPQISSTDPQARFQLVYQGHPSCGIWQRMSYINHACNGNAMRSFIGDMLIVRATRDIGKDEEIFMPYRLPNPDNAVIQQELQDSWYFKCDCELCDAEKRTTANQRKQRADAINKIQELIDSHEKELRIEALYKKIKATYDQNVFKDLPKVALVKVGWLLCKAHCKAKSWSKLVAAAVNLLQDLGYQVQMDDRIIEIGRKHCLTTYWGPDAAMYATHGYRKQGKVNIARQFEDLARSLWTIQYGTEHGMVEQMSKLIAAG